MYRNPDFQAFGNDETPSRQVTPADSAMIDIGPPSKYNDLLLSMDHQKAARFVLDYHPTVVQYPNYGLVGVEVPLRVAQLSKNAFDVVAQFISGSDESAGDLLSQPVNPQRVAYHGILVQLSGKSWLTRRQLPAMLTYGSLNLPAPEQ